MRRIEQETFICMDCEATGLDLNADRIIEVGIIKFTFDEVIEEYETLINPERVISPESMAIHHITQEMVAGKPSIEQVLPEILKLIGNHIIIGHGIKFDIDMIDLASKRANIESSILYNQRVDTLRLARYYGGSSVNSLKQLGHHFNVHQEGSHRAMNDVLVNIDVFKHLTKKFRYTNEIFDVLSKPIQMQQMPFGKYKGRAFRDIPLDFLMWAARKDFDEDLLFSLRTEISRRKKGNLFSQASNPFNDL